MPRSSSTPVSSTSLLAEWEFKPWLWRDYSEVRTLRSSQGADSKSSAAIIGESVNVECIQHYSASLHSPLPWMCNGGLQRVRDVPGQRLGFWYWESDGWRKRVSSDKIVDVKFCVEKWWHKGSLENGEVFTDFSFFTKIKKFIATFEAPSDSVRVFQLVKKFLVLKIFGSFFVKSSYSLSRSSWFCLRMKEDMFKLYVKNVELYQSLF